MNLYESVNKSLKEPAKLNEAGEWDDYDEDNIASKNHLTEIAKYISKKVPNGYYDEARGFDAYRGPYAYVSSDITGGELWYGETDEQFQLDTSYGWIVGNKDTLVKALSDEAYLSQLVEETKKYADSLNEAAGDRYIVKKYEGVGAPYGIWDTQTKKYVHRGEKKNLEKECKERNDKDKEKKLKEAEASGNRDLYIKALNAYIKTAISDDKEMIDPEKDPGSLEYLNSLTEEDINNIANEIVDSYDFEFEWENDILEFVYEYKRKKGNTSYNTNESQKLKESASSYETILDKAVEIEDYNGNTIMGFLVGTDGKIEKYYDCDIADEDDDYLFNSGKNLVRIQSNRNGGDMFEEAESEDVWGKIDDLMYTLLHHNKNYTKEQYNSLLDLEELLEEIKKGPKKESALNEREEERSWSDDGKFLNMREMVARALENNIHDKEFTDEEIDQIFGEVVDEDPHMEEIYMEIERQALEVAKKYRGE